MVNNYNLNDENKIFIILEYLFMFFTVLQFNSIYIYSGQFHFLQSIIAISWQLILFLLFIYSSKYINNKNINNLIGFIFIFIFISILFFMYNSIRFSSLHLNYIFKLLIDPILLISSFYCCSTIKQLNKLLTSLENLIVALSSMSLMFWLLYILDVPTNCSVFISHWGGHHMAPGYFNIDFFTQLNTKFLGINWVRNSSVFVEPSMFAYVILIAVLIDLFIKHNETIFNYKLIILLITIITTASTTGILVSIVAFIYHSIMVLRKNGSSKVIFIFILPILIIILKIVFSYKIGGSNTDTGSSYNIRADDISAGFKTWLEHPVLGSGLGNNDAIRANMSAWRFFSGIPGNSAGFPAVLAQGGIIWGLFYLLPTILVSKISNKLLGFAIFSFIPFIFVTSQMSNIYIIIISYFWAIFLKQYDN